MGQQHLTLGVREMLERCFALGYSLREIGRITGYSAAALHKERKKNSVKGEYQAKEAHQRACTRRQQAAYRKRKLCPELEEYIFEKLQDYWSPEQIAGRLRMDFPDDPRMRISFKTIYTRIARGTKKRTRWAHLGRFLRLKRAGKSLRNWSSRNRGPSSSLRSIDERPAEVFLKQRFGDWESDLLCGPKGKGHIATFVERTTGFLLATSCLYKSASAYNQAAVSTLKHLPAGAVRSVTVDRGCEFYGYREIEQTLQIPYYFCHARSPNERGLNEQVNGLLRQFFPKRKSLLNIEEELKAAVNLLNNRPRKTLGYRTPAELVGLLGNMPLAC